LASVPSFGVSGRSDGCSFFLGGMVDRHAKGFVVDYKSVKGTTRVHAFSRLAPPPA
jgi:hypothetical protein